jgi:hypothetical protein
MEGDTWAHDAPMEAKRAMVDLGCHVSRLTSSLFIDAFVSRKPYAIILDLEAAGSWKSSPSLWQTLAGNHRLVVDTNTSTT